MRRAPQLVQVLLEDEEQFSKRELLGMLPKGERMWVAVHEYGAGNRQQAVHVLRIDPGHPLYREFQPTESSNLYLPDFQVGEPYILFFFRPPELEEVRQPAWTLRGEKKPQRTMLRFNPLPVACMTRSRAFATSKIDDVIISIDFGSYFWFSQEQFRELREWLRQ